MNRTNQRLLFWVWLGCAIVIMMLRIPYSSTSDIEFDVLSGLQPLMKPEGFDEFVSTQQRLTNKIVPFLPLPIVHTRNHSPLKIFVVTCTLPVYHDISSTLGRFKIEFVDDIRLADVVFRCVVECAVDDVRLNLCRTNICPLNPDSKTAFADFQLSVISTNSTQLNEGALGLWEDSSFGLGRKSRLCILSQQLLERNLVVSPPCFLVPRQTQQLANHVYKYPYWLYKPSLSSSGHGIRLITSHELWQMIQSPIDDGLVQQYVHNPFIYDVSREPSGENLRIKTDIRVYGIITSVNPFRLYLSNKGYFRTGHPQMNFTMQETDDPIADRFRHITNNGPKIRAGIFESSAAFEHGFGSAGTFEKLWEMMKASGLEPRVVWDNIRSMFARVLITQMSKTKNACIPTNDCHLRFFSFFADVSITDTGEALLMEIHPSCALKPPLSSSRLVGGEMEGGFDVTVTRSIRQATWSLEVMSIGRFFDGGFRDLVVAWIDHQSQKIDDLEEIDDELREALIATALEIRLACVLDLDPVLPSHWWRFVKELDGFYLWKSLRLYSITERLQLLGFASGFAGRNEDGTCSQLRWKL